MPVPNGSIASAEPASRISILLNLFLWNIRICYRYLWILLLPVIVVMVLGAAWPLTNTLLLGFTEAPMENIDHQWFVPIQYLDYATEVIRQLLTR